MMNDNGIPPINRRTLGYFARLLGGQHSRFFRPMIFTDTKAFLVSEINSHKRISPQPLRVTVVGCAAGEEVYSLAIALHKDGILKGVTFRALDKDPCMVVTAARGLYNFDEYGGRLDFFDDIPDGCREYIIASSQQENIFTVDQRIKKAIIFQLADAVADDFSVKVSEQDVFIVNNVLVHMDEEKKSAVVNNLIGRLSSRGKIISNENIGSPFLRLVNKQGSIYFYEKI